MAVSPVLQRSAATLAARDGSAQAMPGRYASTDETSARAALESELAGVLGKIGSHATGTASNAATNASLRAVAGDLMRALQTYDPHSASVTRAFKAEVDALSQAVDGHEAGSVPGLQDLQKTLARLGPGQDSISHARADNQATMADLLQNAAAVGRDAAAEAAGPNGDPSAAGSDAAAAQLQPLIQQLASAGPGLTGLNAMFNNFLQAAAGDLLALSRRAGASPGGQQAIQAAIGHLSQAASGGDPTQALAQLRQDVAALGSGANLAPLEADTAMASHLASLRQAPTPTTSSSTGVSPSPPPGYGSGSTGATPGIDTLSDPAIAKWKQYEGKFWGDNEQCVSLTRALTPGLAPSSEWKQGEKVQGNTNLKPGTPIATFNFNGRYGPSDHPGGWYGVSHTGIYLGQNAEGVLILDQWNGKQGGAGAHVIPWADWNGKTAESGDKYYAIT